MRLPRIDSGQGRAQSRKTGAQLLRQLRRASPFVDCGGPCGHVAAAAPTVTWPRKPSTSPPAVKGRAPQRARRDVRRQPRERARPACGVHPARNTTSWSTRLTEHGSGLGTVCWVVGRTFAWLTTSSGLVRYDRRHEIHEAFLAIGRCLVCYRRLQHFASSS